MDSDHPETEVGQSAAANEDATGEAPETAPTDVAALVDRMVEAGEWPDPDLLEQIAAAGEAALGPLLAFMRTYPRGYQREIALDNGLRILGAIRSPATIPDLIEIIRRYPEEPGEQAAQVLGEFGAIAFEPVLKFICDPAVKDYPRVNAIAAAAAAAGTDPILKARLAEVLRPMLADAMERTREDIKQSESAEEPEDEQDEEIEGPVLADLEEDEEPSEEEELEEPSEDSTSAGSGAAPAEDRTVDPLEPYEDVMFFIMDLSELADPLARDLINTAFAEDLVETFWIDERTVDKRYREGGVPPKPPVDWLGNYRKEYQSHVARLDRPATLPRPTVQTSAPQDVPATPVEQLAWQPAQPIRNTRPKVGRNDPCWCGSGKKYKKCHMTQDDRA